MSVDKTINFVNNQAVIELVEELEKRKFNEENIAKIISGVYQGTGK